MTLNKHVLAIRKTGHVHRNWYLETYPDVARLDMEPAEHYLKYGAAMGRDPGKNFSTKYYLERYPDVEESGLNPLLHFAYFGKKEGRASCGAQIDKDATRLIHYLWGSPATDQVIAELEKIADNPACSEHIRFEVIRMIAVRHAFDGDLQRALSRISSIPEITPGMVHEKSYLVLHAFLHLLNNNKPKARELLNRFLASHKGQGNADATLALANTCEADNDRLELLNAVYSREDLTPLRLRDPQKPLTLDNIEGASVAPCTADYGLVSVIMPIYMAEDMIETAIRSLCQQSYRNIEIVAVDDCSSDGTFAVLERLAAEDSRIRPVRQEVNAGAYPARNRGLELARGQFITTHDADDWSHPQKIETQIKALMAGNAQGVVAHWIRVTRQLHVTTNWRATSEVLHWSHSTFLTRREVFDKLGSWDNVRISADTEMIWRMQTLYGPQSLEKVMPNAPLAFALDDDNSLTRSRQTHVSTVYYGLRRFYREIVQHWHRQPDGLGAQSHAKRLKMIPDEMFHKPDGPVQLDLVLNGDCTNPKVVSKMRDILQAPAHVHHSVGIDHQPDITRLPGRFAHEFFELLSHSRVRPVIPGAEIIATKEIDVHG